MGEGEIGRVKQDLSIIREVMGLHPTWTRNDVVRGCLGNVAGGLAGLGLALWAYSGQQLETGIVGFLLVLGLIVILKDVGYRRSLKERETAHSNTRATEREVSFVTRFLNVGWLGAGLFFFWAKAQGFDGSFLLAANTVLCAGVYSLFAITSPGRLYCFCGAIPLALAGFSMPWLSSFSMMVAMMGAAAFVGCWGEGAVQMAHLANIRKSNGAH